MEERPTGLGARLTRSTVLFIIFLAALIFACAGTVDYWQAWVYLANFAVWTGAIGAYLAKYNPTLAERRLNSGPASEQQPAQKRIQAFNSVAILALYAVSGLQHRFAGSSMPIGLVIAGNLLTALGFVGCLFVFRQNSFASATIGIAKGQTVVTNGLYGIVRHPMYTAGLLIFLGAPLSLGSWWGLIAVPFLIGGLVTRLLDEEKYLSADLLGYGAYCERVRYRLVPLVY